MNGTDPDGGDWWRLTKNGSLVLAKETNDKFNTFYDTEGLEITSTNKPMAYLNTLTHNKKGFSKVDGGLGTKPNFINLRMAQAQVISLAIFNDDLVYNQMVNRAKKEHWYSRKFFQKMRGAGDLPSKKAASAVFDILKSTIGFVAGGKVGTGLNVAQQGSMTFNFGGIIEASFNASDLSGLQNRIGKEVYKSQQKFINVHNFQWQQIKGIMPSINRTSSFEWGGGSFNFD